MLIDTGGVTVNGAAPAGIAARATTSVAAASARSVLRITFTSCCSSPAGQLPPATDQPSLPPTLLRLHRKGRAPVAGVAPARAQNTMRPGHGGAAIWDPS